MEVRPPSPNQIGLGVGGAAPLSFFSSTSFPFSRAPEGKGGRTPSSLSYLDSLEGGARQPLAGFPLSLRPMLSQHFHGGFR